MDKTTLTFKASEITVNGPDEDEDICPGQVNVVLSAKAIAALQKWAALADRVHDVTNADPVIRGTLSFMKFRANSLIEVNASGTTPCRKEILMFPRGTCYLQFAFGKYGETTYEVPISSKFLIEQGQRTTADDEH